MSDQHSLAEELVTNEQRIGRAIATGDPSVLEALLAPDFVGTTPTGTVLGKPAVLDSLFSPAYDIETFENADIEVRFFGDVAVVLGRGVVRGKYNGHDASGQFRYTRVWTRLHGQWQAVAAHSSMLSEANTA
jgi:ketosteroid isomerase-like protein